MRRPIIPIYLVTALAFCVPSAAVASLGSNPPFDSQVAPAAADLMLTFNHPINLEKSELELLDEAGQIVPFTGLRVSAMGLTLQFR